MDDLISRKATIEALEFEKEYHEAPDRITGIEDAIEVICTMPSVQAVPLEPLCEWLSENSINIPCECCQNFANDYCTAIGDASKPCPKTADSWRQAITKWMEGQQKEG